jgi:O-antigen ligase
MTSSGSLLRRNWDFPSAGWVALFAVCAAVAWLIPTHFLPWTAFQSDLLTAIGLGIACLGAIRLAGARMSLPASAVAVLALALVPIGQVALGMTFFSGDGWLAALYLAGLALAIVAGREFGRRGSGSVEPLLWAFVGAGVVSSALASCQWLGVEISQLRMAPLPPGGRPFANLAQPNQLATLLMLGVVAAALLHQMQCIGSRLLAVFVVVFVWGAALTGSRTAWVEMAGFVLWVWALRDRAGLRLTRGGALSIGLTLAVFVVAVPSLADLLLISGTGLRLEPGVRPIHWAILADAIGQRPWLGYGWNQVSVAVSQVALNHPAPHEMVEHSHNLVLDLAAWNGIPIALAVIVGVALWIAHHGWRRRDAQAALLVALIGVALVHSMFEFPLEYAHFLLPIGFVAGVLDSRAPLGPRIGLPRWSVVGFAAVAAMATLWVAVEYIEVEENSRALRFEAARIGAGAVPSGAPDVVLLTQQREFLRFARTQAHRGMTDGELDSMRRVAERFAYPPVLFRYALALGLNERPQAAARALGLLCKLHPPKLCEEARSNWSLMSDGSYPELQKVTWLSHQAGPGSRGDPPTPR